MSQGRLFICIPDGAARAPEALVPKVRDGIGAVLEAADIGRFRKFVRVAARFGGDDEAIRDFAVTGEGQAAHPEASHAVAAVYDVTDFLVAESLVWDAAWKSGLKDDIVVHFVPGACAGAGAAENERQRYIEIYYDIASIPPGFSHPLDFRNAAMELVEQALVDADAGEWDGAEIGMGEVNFGFEVTDFDRAEAIVRAAVKGTRFEGIREIARRTYPDDMVAAE